MEEVDSIILHFLRQLQVELPDEVKSITELPADTIVLAVSKCLNVINPSLKAPKSLPQGISHRIEVAAQVAAMCKDLGYKSEVGYQTFLYYNEADLRKVFMFLIECLPTDTEKAAATVVQFDSNSLLWQKIRIKIAEDLDAVWIPPSCKPNFNKSGDHSDISYDCTDDKRNFHKKKQPDEAHLMAMFTKMKEMCVQDKYRLSKLTHKDTITNISKLELKSEKQVASELLLHNTSEVNLKDLKEEAITLRQKLSLLGIEKKTLDGELLKLKSAHERVDIEIKQFEDMKTLMGELGVSKEDGFDKVVTKLKKDIERLHLRSDECTHRNLTLKGQIESVKQELKMSDSERNKRLNALESLKATARDLKEEYRAKEQSKEQLRKEYEKINRGGTKRSIYTKKIMEIIGNVAKQKVEIEKILGDTRQIQKEINNYNGQLDRSFSVADETLFRDAKKDDQAKKAYKLLALLHSECNTIVSLVNDTGALSRELVDLEDHIDAEKSKRTEDTLQRIQQDLLQMQKEVESLQC